MMTPLLADGSLARISAAAAATMAAEADVPETDVVVPAWFSVRMDSPGAPMKASAPVFANEATVSPWVVAVTPTTPASPAG